jgi:hypothetical protein
MHRTEMAANHEQSIVLALAEPRTSQRYVGRLGVHPFSEKCNICDYLASLLSDADDQHSFGKLVTKAFQQYLYLLQSMIVTAVITL